MATDRFLFTFLKKATGRMVLPMDARLRPSTLTMQCMGSSMELRLMARSRIGTAPCGWATESHSWLARHSGMAATGRNL